ncbi:MAG TPA: protein kinase, partial [Chroococcales cyanobacterium]
VWAVRILKPAGQQASMRRFQAEGPAILKLDHPNIARLHDIALSDDLTPVAVTEYVEGSSLKRLLAEQPIELERALRLIRQVASALVYAHRNGVIHRDLKPGNIMVVPACESDAQERKPEQVKILDFGMARVLEDVPAEATGSGEVFGTPGYMSPEQALGKRSDARADQYSFACVIFEMIAGKPPYRGKNAISTMSLHISAPIPSLAEAASQPVPPRLEQAVMNMMQKDPDHRFVTLEDAATAMFGGNNAVRFKQLALASVISILLLGAYGFFTLPSPQSLSPASKRSTISGSITADDRALAQLVKESPTARVLDLRSDFKILTDEGLKSLVNLRNLERLELPHSPHITNAGIKVLAQAKLPLNMLNLEGTGVTDGVMRWLIEMPTLQTLSLCTTRISDASSAYFLSLPQLRILYLGATDITKESLRSIGKLPKLQELYLNDDAIGGGLEYLSRSKLHLLSLNRVHLSRQDLQDITGIASIDDLAFKECELSDDEVKIIATMPDVKKLELSCDSQLTAQALQSLGRMPRLSQLILDGDTITDGIKYLIGSNIAVLSVQRTELSDGDISALSRMKRLAVLSLRETKITDAQLLRLAKVKNLERIALQGCANLTAHGRDEFSRNSKCAIDGSILRTAKAPAEKPSHWVYNTYERLQRN